MTRQAKYILAYLLTLAAWNCGLPFQVRTWRGYNLIAI
jgi:hypothetical protein